MSVPQLNMEPMPDTVTYDVDMSNAIPGAPDVRVIGTRHQNQDRTAAVRDGWRWEIRLLITRAGQMGEGARETSVHFWWSIRAGGGLQDDAVLVLLEAANAKGRTATVKEWLMGAARSLQAT